MASSVYCWPPGTVDRFHVLRRKRYCGALTKCAHPDPSCCCREDFECCELTQDLLLEFSSDDCPDLDGHTIPLPLKDKILMLPDEWEEPGDYIEDCFYHQFNFICDLLSCPETATKTCECYKLSNLVSASTGCELDPQVIWPESDCTCFPDPYWRFEAQIIDNYDGVGMLEHCECCCTDPWSCYPVDVTIEIYDPAASKPVLTSTRSKEFKEVNKLTLPKKSLRFQGRDAELPPDVENWLNGDSSSE